LSVLNPLRTADGSNLVEITHLDHGLNVGDAITIEGASATGGINTAQLNVTDQVREIIDENTYTYQAGGTANDSEDGGGNVKVVSHAPIRDWDEQSWSAVRGYPAAVTFHENRLCFGGTIAEPDNIWMSKVGSFFNFDVGDAADSDSIQIVAATGDVNQIRYMVSNRDLQIFTATGELYVPTYLNQAITPTNAQIRKQTPYGTEFVQPTSIDGATIFAEMGGRTVREYLYTDTEEAYTATSISTIASHLIDSPKYLTVVHSGFDLPDSYAAITLGNGDISLFSSNRAEKKASWTRVTTDGRFSSVVAIHNRLFANVYYGNKLCLCEFTKASLSGVGSRDMGIDNFIYVAGYPWIDVSSLYSVGDTVTLGVWTTPTTWLGEHPVVSNSGVASVDVSAYQSFGGNFWVGRAFTAKIVSNPVDASMGNGPATGEVRGITNVVVDVKNTDSLRVNNRPVISSNFTGKKEVRLLGYNRNPQITIEQDNPAEMQVNGLVAELIV